MSNIKLEVKIKSCKHTCSWNHVLWAAIFLLQHFRICVITSTVCCAWDGESVAFRGSSCFWCLEAPNCFLNLNWRSRPSGLLLTGNGGSSRKKHRTRSLVLSLHSLDTSSLWLSLFGVLDATILFPSALDNWTNPCCTLGRLDNAASTSAILILTLAESGKGRVYLLCLNIVTSCWFFDACLHRKNLRFLAAKIKTDVSLVELEWNMHYVAKLRFQFEFSINYRNQDCHGHPRRGVSQGRSCPWGQRTWSWFLPSSLLSGWSAWHQILKSPCTKAIYQNNELPKRKESWVGG